MISKLAAAISNNFRKLFGKNLGYPAPAEGERYMGAIIRADGTGHHIYLLDIRYNDAMQWEEALKYAEKHGAEIPDRAESILLAGVPIDEKYRLLSHWTREQIKTNPNVIWLHHFNDTDSMCRHKSEYRHFILIRRVAFNQFKRTK